MDWSTLIAVVVGGLIATVPTIINNVYQERQRKEDREEQRREAKIQTREKWIEHDILEIMVSIKKINNLITQARKIFHADSNTQARLKDNYENLLLELNQIARKTIILLNSFEDEGLKKYRSFVGLLDRYLLVFDHISDKWVDEEVDRWLDFMDQSGEIQKALREKLISIRDSK